MAGIYQADIWCDDCIADIKQSIYDELWENRGVAECPDGTKVSEFEDCGELSDHLDFMDEYHYNSDQYPKYCSADAESDCPEHCAGCGEFMGNSLTSDGADYVVRLVREALEEGRNDCVAITEWMPHYFWLDFPNFGVCEICGHYGELDSCDECVDSSDCIDRAEEADYANGELFHEGHGFTD